MSGKILKKITAPESTIACTSGYTDFQVLPVDILIQNKFINLSFKFN